MRFRLRLLPVAILGATLLLTVKVRDMWSEADVVLSGFTVGTSFAETPEPEMDHAAEPSSAGDDAEPVEEDASGLAGLDLDAQTFDPMMLSRAEIELLQNLHARRKQIDAREKEVALREQLLVATQEALDAKIEDLKSLEQKIEALIGQYDESREARLKSLVKIYENMKPKDAAQIFASLEGDILLDVVERMREAKAAPILALLEPDQAKRITVDLAERSKEPMGPTE